MIISETYFFLFILKTSSIIFRLLFLFFESITYILLFRIYIILYSSFIFKFIYIILIIYFIVFSKLDFISILSILNCEEKEKIPSKQAIFCFVLLSLQEFIISDFILFEKLIVLPPFYF